MQKNPRITGERASSQAMFGNDRAEDDDELEQPEQRPNFITARELLARGPAKGVVRTEATTVRQDSGDDDEDEAPKKGERAKGQ